MTATIHSVVHQAVLNAVSVPWKMCDFMANGITLPNMRIVGINYDAVSAEAASPDVAEYLACVHPQIRLYHRQSKSICKADDIHWHVIGKSPDDILDGCAAHRCLQSIIGPFCV